MKIRLTRGTGAKPGTLTCVRDDGSVTWQRSSPYFAYHDLVHYAVETTLEYREAFFGVVALGKDLGAFGTRGGVRDTYRNEEQWAEAIVGALQWPSAGGGPPLSAQELVEMVRARFADEDLQPGLTAGEVEAIRAVAAELHARWADVPPDASMELEF